MNTKKQEILDYIHSLPETMTTLDIIESLLVKQQIEKGLADVDAGYVITNEELKSRLAQWRKSNGH